MPATRVEFHPEATSEVRAAQLRYSEHGERAAQAFPAEIDRAVELIAVLDLDVEQPVGDAVSAIWVPSASMQFARTHHASR